MEPSLGLTSPAPVHGVPTEAGLAEVSEPRGNPGLGSPNLGGDLGEDPPPAIEHERAHPAELAGQSAAVGSGVERAAVKAEGELAGVVHRSPPTAARSHHRRQSTIRTRIDRPRRECRIPLSMA
jgi:hypothetical protein